MHTRNLTSTVITKFMVGLLLVLIATGCKVTSEDIETWKGTVKGPGKIVAVLLSDRYPMELRAQSALALIEMERRDVNGVKQLQAALTELQTTDAATSQEIVSAMVPKLEEMMSGSGSAENEDFGPPKAQIQAKDAAYILTKSVQGETRDRLIKGVVGWYAKDFPTRSLAGNHSAEEVVGALGAPAASQLVDGLNARMPKEALVKICELIGQLGDAPTKQRAGTRIVEIQREMEGKEFFQWLGNEIASAIEKSTSTKPPKDRVIAAATLNREKFITQGALPSMRYLADQNDVRTRLLQIASTAPADDLPGVLKDQISNRRQGALQALEGHVTEDHLDQILPLALNESNPVNVRDYAFDRLSDLHSRKAIPKLWPVFEVAENTALKKRTRWRAGELLLASGGSQIVPEFVRRMPAGPEIEYEPAELEGYATRMSQLTRSTTIRRLMIRQLRAKTWWTRVLALRYFARKGTEKDIARMRRLTKDSARVLGDEWERNDPPIKTVGSVATAAIKALRDRLAKPTEAPKDEKSK